MTAPVPPDANGLREAVESLAEVLRAAIYEDAEGVDPDERADLPREVAESVLSSPWLRDHDAALLSTVRAPEEGLREAVKALAEEWELAWVRPSWRIIVGRTVPSIPFGEAANRLRTLLAASEAAPTAGEQGGCGCAECRNGDDQWCCESCHVLARQMSPATPPADDASEGRGCQSRNPEPPHQRCENVVCDGSHRDYPSDPRRAEARWTDTPFASTDASEGLSEAEVADMLALRFPSWQQYERDEFAHRIGGIVSAAATRARAEERERIAQVLEVEWRKFALAGHEAGVVAARLVRIARSDAAPNTGAQS